MAMDSLNAIDVEGICDRLEGDETVVIKQSTLIVISPNSKRKSDVENSYGDQENNEEGEEEEGGGEFEMVDGEEEAYEEETGDSVDVPTLGMSFNSWEEVEKYLKAFGKQQGFGFSRAQGVKSRNDSSKRRAITWKCECWGDPDMRTTRLAKKRAKEMEIGGSSVVDQGKKRKRRSKKCNCPVNVYASVGGDGSWIIRKLNLVHQNHQPKPEQARFVKEYRMQSFTSRVRRRIFNDVDAGVPLCTTFASIAQERMGVENMPFTVKDARGEVDKVRRLKMEGGDAVALVNYFDKMRRENINFFHSHRTDEHGYLKDIIWVEARSRLAYEEFGDVVCFDSTYLTNEYKLPFANFVGVNHHGQSTLLGCALVSTEDSETYHWLFSQWLLCMHGKAPRGILTDQAAAFRGPLEELMPDTIHRWCIWHILNKLPRRCRGVKSYDEFSEELLQVIYNSFTIGEFETGWREVMSKYKVEEVEKAHEWLSNLFEERHMWVPTFTKHIFWAGMRTTQRVESMNHFFDQFINRHTRLFEFGEKYTAAVKKRATQEKEADEADEKWWRKASTVFPIEKQFRKIYTDAKYRVLQRECERLLYVRFREEIVVETNKYVYVLEDRVWVLPKGFEEEIVTDRRRMYSVEFDSSSKEANCCCKMFETHGILCRHVLFVYDQNFVTSAPEKYILRRWRRDVVRKHAKISVGGILDPKKAAFFKRHDNISKAADLLCDLGALYEESEKIAIKGINGVVKKLKDWISKKEMADKGKGECTNDDGGASEKEDATLDNEEGTNENDLLVDGTPASKLEGTQGSQIGCSKTPHSSQTPMSTSNTIKDPPIPKKRGRPKTTRFKSVEETGWKSTNGGKGKGKKKKKGDSNLNELQSSLKGYVDSGGFENQLGKVKLSVRRKAALANASQNESVTNYCSTEDPLLQLNDLSFNVDS